MGTITLTIKSVKEETYHWTSLVEGQNKSFFVYLLFRKDHMDIFISYSRADMKAARAFYKALTNEGWSVWIDQTGIETGDAFKHKITDAIESCKVFVFLSSKNSNASRWVANEIGVAMALDKPVIPVKLDGARYNKEVLLDLVNLDYIDYHKDEAAGMVKLLSSLRKKLGPGKKVTPPSMPAPAKKQPGSKPEGYGLVIILASFILILAGAILIPTLLGGRHPVKVKAKVDKSVIEAIAKENVEVSSSTDKRTVPVEFKSVPSGALVAINDTNVRWVTPATISLEPGKEYTVKAALEGYGTYKETFRVTDSLNVVSMTLEKKKATAQTAATSSSAKPADSNWIPCSGVSLCSYRLNDKITDRSTRIQYLVGSVTLIANPYHKKGPIKVYMVVTNPNNELLTNSESGTFSFKGKKIRYSASREVDYQGENLDVSIYLKDIDTPPSRKDSAYVYFKGIYKAALYTENQELGKAEMLLR